METDCNINTKKEIYNNKRKKEQEELMRSTTLKKKRKQIYLARRGYEDLVAAASEFDDEIIAAFSGKLSNLVNQSFHEASMRDKHCKDDSWEK